MRRYRDAIFVPKDPATSFADDPCWGLYDSDGGLIDAASYTRGTERIRVGQSPTTAHRPTRLAAQDAPYLYAGPFHFHFGHFLLASLGRLWPCLDEEWRGARIVCHGRGDPTALLRPPFARDVAAALGLGPGDFAHFVEPVRLPEVLVPEPCMDEDQGAHAVYAELGAAIGARLRAARPAPADGRTGPVYLSKSRLTQGVWRFRNEIDLEHCLIERGIEVVHPETLGLAEQVRLFETRAVVLGTAGSALHTSILAGGPARIVGLARSGWIHSSQIVIDRLRGNPALYLDLGSILVEAGPGDGFGTNLDIASPAALADQLVRAVDTVRRAGTVPDPADYDQARFPG